jgi:uncharacterized protein YcbX
MPTVSALYIYPVKSLGGIALQQSKLSELGLQYDRRWMIIDKNNEFISQRTYPSLALLGTILEKDNIKIYHKHTGESIDVPLLPNTSIKKQVTIWDDVCEGVVVDEQINVWLSDYLQKKVELVFMPETSERLVDYRYVMEDSTTSFSDGYSFLLISEASLEELNNLAGTDFGMDRFRPNIVVTESLPQEEEEWHEMQIGTGLFTGVKPCARCVLTTIDQDSGIGGKEPLKTLATYKRVGKRILFGQNLVYNGGGKLIKIGDEVLVKSRKKIEFAS